MKWRVRTQWFSEPEKYWFFETEQEAKDFISTAEVQRLWWVLEARQ